ncbi:MAG TPA: transcriptional repressor LexA [Chloroflexota bacterium]
MRSLSDRQRRILDFIAAYTSEHGFPPSIREIGQAVGISSTSVVDYNLRVLEREGHIRRARDVSRGVVVDSSRTPPRTVQVPVLGRIAAGEPIEAVEGHPDTLELPANLAPEGCYALQVKGESMIEDLIADGDIVVVRPQETANNGDIVVALLADERFAEGVATLKRFYRERDRIRLQPANSAMAPMFVDPERVRVQGKVVALFRQMA